MHLACGGLGFTIGKAAQTAVSAAQAAGNNNSNNNNSNRLAALQSVKAWLAGRQCKPGSKPALTGWTPLPTT